MGGMYLPGHEAGFALPPQFFVVQCNLAGELNPTNRQSIFDLSSPPRKTDSKRLC
jgi:hypothetical protein